MSDSVVVERQGRVQVITINRPEARNALDAETSWAVARAVDEMDESDELRAGVLTGAGGNFSAGMDLKAFLRGESPSVPGRGMCGIIRTPPGKPLVAAVEGWALAGGLEVLLACDLVVASRTARIGVPEVKRSLIAAGGAAILLPRRIPHVLAMEMLLTGEPISADRAAEVGLVNRVVPGGKALAAAVELASTIAENGPLAVAATRRIARETASLPLADAWDHQQPIVDPVVASEDAREGATAFAEKRQPIWKCR